MLRTTPIVPTRRRTIVGCLPGGQLLRLAILDARRKDLPLAFITYCKEGERSAALLADHVVRGDYYDKEKVQAFARRCDVVTIESENLPLQLLRWIEETGVPVIRPSVEALAICQDRLCEKEFVQSAGFDTAPFTPIDPSLPVFGKHVDRVLQGGKGILKTRRFSYDGKGQTPISSPEDLRRVLRDAPAAEQYILEGVVKIAFEGSVIVARDSSGRMACYPLVQNDHRDGILRTTIWAPGRVPEEVEKEAERVATRLASALGIIGLLAVEFFVTQRDAGGRHLVLVNELAPRPHNSGHWTLDGCRVSQFENWLRAVTGLPVLDPQPEHACIMHNLIGEEIRKAPELRANGGFTVYDYEKLRDGEEPRAGRKLGHYTEVGRAVKHTLQETPVYAS